MNKSDQQETYQPLKQKHCWHKQMIGSDGAVMPEMDDRWMIAVEKDLFSSNCQKHGVMHLRSW